MLPPFCGADFDFDRVCIVTIARLILVKQLQVKDYAHDILKISIFSVLEPLLGIIVACSPLFPPAIKNITAKSPKIYIPSSSVVARMRSKRSKRLDDSLPLTDVEETRTQTHQTDSRSKSDDVSGSCGQSDGIGVSPQSSIRVERDWEVRSDRARDIEGSL